MWVPKAAEELEAAVKAGNVDEGATLDFKQELPATPKKNVDLATDIAAMATDGGVVIYGVGENDAGEPTELLPFELAGAEERVQQIIDSRIAEPPHAIVSSLPKGDGTGYIVVQVPQSARAPHMVTVKGHDRYYGRSGPTNRRLTEGDIARLYERRARWETDREELLQQAIDTAGFQRHQQSGHLHALCRPVAVDERRLDAFRSGFADDHEAGAWLRSQIGYPWRFRPTLAEAQWYRIGARAWQFSTRSPDDIKRSTTGLVSGEYVNALDGYSAVHFDAAGAGRLFFGRAMLRSGEGMAGVGGQTFTFERGIAGTFGQFVSIMGAFYERVGYVGAVDVGLALQGCERGSSWFLRERHEDDGPGHLDDDERHTARLAVAELREPDVVPREFLGALLKAAKKHDSYDPWEHQHHR